MENSLHNIYLDGLLAYWWPHGQLDPSSHLATINIGQKFGGTFLGRWSGVVI